MVRGEREAVGGGQTWYLNENGNKRVEKTRGNLGGKIKCLGFSWVDGWVGRLGWLLRLGLGLRLRVRVGWRK